MPRLFRVLVPVCILLFSACQPTHISSHSYTGKLVIVGACDNFVVQFIGSEPVGDKAEANWTDTSSHLNVTYTNVFTVYNRCSFETAGMKKGDVFTFEIGEKKADLGACLFCQIFVPTPAVSNTIVNCQKIK